MAHKILVVDDQPFMVRLIQHHLEKAGYELIKARNSEEAETAMAQEIPQLVLMTERAGEHDDPVPEQKVRGQGPSVPIIRMTDVPETMPQQKPLAGDEIILRKPFSPTKLMAAVKRLLPENPSEPAEI
jgi:DNA-binding response OmpR family regulator